jgi:hypothetical protein
MLLRVWGGDVSEMWSLEIKTVISFNKRAERTASVCSVAGSWILDV